MDRRNKEFSCGSNDSSSNSNNNNNNNNNNKSSIFLSEIVGEDALSGKAMPTGSILDMMDIVAGRCAWNHMKSAMMTTTKNKNKTNNNNNNYYSIATVSFDRVDLLMPVCHMDLVRVSGCVVSTGSGRSSMTIEVIAEKEDRIIRRFLKCCSSYVTMVVIDLQTLGSVKGIVPSLQYQSPEDIQKKEIVQRKRQSFIQFEKLTMDNSDDIATEILANDDVLLLDDAILMNESNNNHHHNHKNNNNNNNNKREYLTIPETTVVVRKQAMPRYLNHNQTIFGGDILIWMEKLATYTAQRFTGNEHVITLSMNRIAFKMPIMVSDLLHMEANVVYVRKFVLEVEIICHVEKRLQPLQLSHTGYFTVMNLDAVGFKREIMVGLKLQKQHHHQDGNNNNNNNKAKEEEEYKQSMEKYIQARNRFQFDRNLILQELATEQRQKQQKQKQQQKQQQQKEEKGTMNQNTKTGIEDNDIDDEIEEFGLEDVKFHTELDRLRYAVDENDSQTKFFLA